MSVAGDFSVWDFLHGFVDGVEPPFGFVGAGHVGFLCGKDEKFVDVTG